MQAVDFYLNGKTALITQRSQVQILPPLPGQRPGAIRFRAFCMRFVNGFVNEGPGSGPVWRAIAGLSFD